MKKIILVTDAWEPQLNGVVLVLESAIKRLRAQGFEVTLIHPGLFHSMSLFFYPEIRLAWAPRRTIEAIIDKVKPDYIHIATEGPIGVSVRSVCKRRKLLFTTSYHSHFPRYIKLYAGALEGVAYRFVCWFHSAAAATFASNLSLKEELEEHGFKNIRIWPLGVDTNFFVRDESRAYYKDLPKPVFLYFGRVAIEKNIEEFLACDLPGSKLVVGDGPLRKVLEERYSAAHFVGTKRGHMLVDILSGCDVMVFPSHTETFGLVTIEALSMGIPVAAHDVMGPKDVITSGVDGFLDTDLAHAARACLELVERSPGIRDRCREKALTYTWDASITAFIKNQIPVSGESPEKS